MDLNLKWSRDFLLSFGIKGSADFSVSITILDNEIETDELVWRERLYPEVNHPFPKHVVRNFKHREKEEK